METIFVIRNLFNNRYLSIQDGFDDFNMCKKFKDEISALKEVIQLDGYFVIEKVYKS